VQSEHLGDLGRGIAPHDIALYHFREPVKYQFEQTRDFGQIFGGFSIDLRGVKTAVRFVSA
jgi:hypothetical protein